MSTLGEQLKTAREAKGVSEKEAGSAIRILTKLILAMEADDFSVMAAPTYAKGFIRLYATYLGLAPEPLVQEYLATHAVVAEPRPRIGKRGRLKEKQSGDEPAAPKETKTLVRLPRIALPQNLIARFSSGWNSLPGDAWKDIRVLAGAAATLLLLIVLISSISNYSRRHASANPEEKASQTDPAHILLDEPIPDLYLIEPGKIESN